MDYEPPFRITNEILNLISDISTKVGQLKHFQDFSTRPQLRKNNRIQSIYSSLAIEANSLTLGQVRDVIAGRTVLGPQQEIQEVKNAYTAYENLDKIDAFSLNDLLKTHAILGKNIIKEAGRLRSGEEGVFSDGKCIFMAPPARLVPTLMEDLFDWMNAQKNELHPLLISAIFHYEFVFIHPFSDGNGRMARLWQTAILMTWQKLFQYIPIENQIHKYQEDYYNAISESHKTGQSTAFITFMLHMIDEVLSDILQRNDTAEYDPYIKKLLSVMEYGCRYTAQELQTLLSLKTRTALKRTYLTPALELGLVAMSLPDKPTSRNQQYYRID